MPEICMLVSLFTFYYAGGVIYFFFYCYSNIIMVLISYFKGIKEKNYIYIVMYY